MNNLFWCTTFCPSDGTPRLWNTSQLEILTICRETLAVEHQSVGNEYFFQTGKKGKFLFFFILARSKKMNILKY